MRKYAMIRGNLLRTLQFLAEKDLPVNTENLMKYCDDIKEYRQAGGLIRRLRTNGMIETKGYEITPAFLDWLEKKK